MKKSYPIKTCDYCKADGKAYTFMSGETICPKCFSSISTDPEYMRHEIFKLRARNVELEAEVERLRGLLK